MLNRDLGEAGVVQCLWTIEDLYKLYIQIKRIIDYVKEGLLQYTTARLVYRWLLSLNIIRSQFATLVVQDKLGRRPKPYWPTSEIAFPCYPNEDGY